MGLFQDIKEAHLKSFLEDEHHVKILKKYGAYLILQNGNIINFFYTIADVRVYLENKFKKDISIDDLEPTDDNINEEE